MNRSLAAVVLAAGKGVRMKSARPKVMHRVAGLPMIGHVLRALESLGCTQGAVVIAPGMEAVRAAVAPWPTVVQAEQLGTAHAVLAAQDALAGFAGDLLVAYGDTPLITGPTLGRLVERRRAGDDPAVVVLGMRPDNPAEYGRLIVDGAGRLEAIVEFREAGPEQRGLTLCNAGVMALDAARVWPLLRDIGNDNAKGEYYLTDVVAVARRRGLACAFVEAPAEEVLGVNSRAELAVVEAHMQQRLRARAMAEGATLVDPTTVFFSHDTRLGRDVTVGPFTVFGPGVTVGDDVEIRGFCHIEGAAIAAGAVVGPYARLRPGTRLGEGVHIGNFVETKNAELGPGTKANHLTYLGDSTVGPGTNIGAGTITCNYDGFRKLRTTIGARVFIGTNSALVAPVAIGDGAFVAAGSVITRDVPADAMAVARGQQVDKPGWARKFREKMQALVPGKG
ncbi:MAG: bifunctional UDP-N-acetylglucosamine diphosphorylase/glucosamine-1-phosphate N-acetyltransferase GlmU [Rhodospirillaceae bacterium]|nr:bifunctional UDP-N-acetylglucosamine diphosphorylase/glucosamine-1-phosphate N-acetyltransferase GlmU [Rhodospirillaceae bacterium]